MKLAVMQPYFFPYIGYFQLINAVDTFVFYDDVNFIKKGWINRNRIKVNNKSYLFTIPICSVSQNNTINDTYINHEEFTLWRRKFLKTLKQHYSKAPFYDNVYPLIETVVNYETENIAEISKISILKILQYLDLNKNIVFSSEEFANKGLKSQERIIDICKKMDAGDYFNLSGGMSLYNRDLFHNNNIRLKFISSKGIQYSQLGDNFLPHLSMIDVIMNNPKNKVFEFLNSYELE